MASRFDSVEKRMEFNAPEKYFEYLMDLKEHRYIKYGLDKSLPKLSRFVRNTPDYIVQSGDYNTTPHFVEVKGSKSKFKIKTKDYYEYIKWNKIMPLFFYFYSYQYKQNKWVTFEKIKELKTTAETGVYENNNEEFFIVEWSLV